MEETNALEAPSETVSKRIQAFEVPPERPECQPPSKQPSLTKHPPKPVSPQDRLPPKSLVASDLPELPELTGLAAMVTESERMSPGLPPAGSSSGMAGLGSGVAGVLQGSRFQLGAPGNPLPEYPYRARRNGFEGRVVLAVQVSGDGKPLSVRIASSSGFGVLDRAALRTVQRWQFLPVVGVENRHIAEVRVPITFKLTDG
jgi:protein TonB